MEGLYKQSFSIRHRGAYSSIFTIILNKYSYILVVRAAETDASSGYFSSERFVHAILEESEIYDKL